MTQSTDTILTEPISPPLTREARLVDWRQRLTDRPPLLKLPLLLYGPKPSERVAQGAVAKHNFSFSPDLSQALQEACQSKAISESASLPTLICAALATVFFRYSEQPDLLLGMLSDDKLAEGPQVLRLNLDGNPAFDLVLAHTQQVIDEAQQRIIPFTMLVDALSGAESEDHHPLIQALFTWQTEAYRPSASMPALDIQLVLRCPGETLEGQWLYRPDHVDEETVIRLSDHLQTLLAGIVADCQTPIGQLPLLTDSERQMMLIDWNDTAVDHPLDQGVHDIFAERAAEYPDYVAVTYGDQQLTYRDLNARVNQMAHYLLAEGIKAGDLVGVFVERSTDVVVLMLAVFKVGGVYLPLDPTYPSERLAFMLEDTGASLLLTRQTWLDNLPDHAAKVICLDMAQESIAVQPIDNSVGRTSSDQLAYIIYTSGSTGQPKGVMVEHRSLTNVVMNDVRRLQLSPADRLTQFFSLSFDAAITEILCPLCAGAQLYVLTEEQVLHGPALIDLLQTAAITHLFLTPSVLATLSAFSPDDFPALKALFAAGEACTPDLVKRWSGGRTFYNVYGPTEFAIAATLGECTRHDVPPPIGHIYDNCQAYVLDQYMQPVPIGVVGELYLGGVQVARGYLNRPELTAEKFVPNPFGDGKLYKTGDLVTYRADGKIVFVGREDGMVKVRGLRIELGEIEATLNAYPRVQQAVVDTVKDSSGRNQQLVAYLVPLQDEADETVSLTLAEISHFAREKLPAYMSLSSYVFLTEFPLTPSGKVDRKKLPRLRMDKLADSGRDTASLGSRSPQTETEKAIATVWCDLLQLDRAGTDENFFALGGHSVLVTQVATRLKDAFQVDFAIRELFEQPTIAEIAKMIDAKTVEQADADLLAQLLVEAETLY